MLNELLDGTRISKYDEKSGSVNVMESFEGVVSNNGTKANPTLQADILGDWREEAIYPTEDSSELRIFSTTIPTEYRLPTLMHDSVYRMGIAWQNTTYNQPPHLGYYLGEDIREKVLSNDLDLPEVDYTPNLAAIKHMTNLEITKQNQKVLLNKLKQVEHHLNKERPAQAIKHMRGYLKHLERSSFTQTIKSKLKQDAHALIKGWQNE